MTLATAFLLWLGACAVWLQPLGNALARLRYGCWMEHGALIRERRASGYWHVCDRCGVEREILPGQHYRARTRLAGKVGRVRAVLRRKAS